MGQTILNSLKSPDVLVWKTMEKKVAAVYPTFNVGCCHGLCTVQADMFLDVTEILDLVKISLADLSDLGLKGEILVEDDPKVPCCL